MFANLRNLVVAGVIALGVSSAALAGNGYNGGNNGYCIDPGFSQPSCGSHWITVYECRTVPYQVCVTRYDHCGNPYQTYVTYYKTIQVPVQKLVSNCGPSLGFPYATNLGGNYGGNYAGNFMNPGALFHK